MHLVYVIVYGRTIDSLPIAGPPAPSGLGIGEGPQIYLAPIRNPRGAFSCSQERRSFPPSERASDSLVGPFVPN